MLAGEMQTDEHLLVHSWNSKFEHHFDDCPPGERPDTLRLRQLPARWFTEPGASYVLRMVGTSRLLSMP